MGGGSRENSYNDLVDAMHNSGVVTAVATGNSNANACNYSPASAKDVITVASSTNTDARSSFSNWGTCVDLFAPGSNINSAWWDADDSYRSISGTSMASPHACGAAALLLGKGVPAADVTSIIYGNTTPNKISNPGTGTPNELLFVGSWSTPPPSTRPPTIKAPTTRPPTTRPPTPPPGDCEDSKGIMMWNDKWRRCKWLGKFKKPCEDEDVRSFCPKTCEADEYCCSDATGEFRTRKKSRDWTCDKVDALPPMKKAKKCALPRMRTTCRETCELCKGGGEIKVMNFDEVDCTNTNTIYTSSYITLDNMYCINKTRNPGSGYDYGTKSLPNTGFNGYSRDMTMTCSGGKFSLVSTWMTPAWNNGLSVTLVGSYGGSEKARVTLSLGNTNAPKFFDSELSAFADVDTVVLSSSSHTVLDDLTMSISSPCNAMPRKETAPLSGDAAGGV